MRNENSVGSHKTMDCWGAAMDLVSRMATRIRNIQIKVSKLLDPLPSVHSQVRSCAQNSILAAPLISIFVLCSHLAGTKLLSDQPFELLSSSYLD